MAVTGVMRPEHAMRSGLAAAVEVCGAPAVVDQGIRRSIQKRGAIPGMIEAGRGRATRAWAARKMKEKSGNGDKGG